MDLGRTAVTVVLFFVILGALVLIHELGHFIVARLAGVRVLEFGLGFPPRARVLRARGETLWTLNWLPIGGFVKLEGEDGDAAGDPRAFSAKSLPTRLLILLAGVGMNLLLAFAIFTAIAWLATPIVGLRVPSVSPGSPAAGAGLVAGDEILSIDSQRYDFYSEGILGALRSKAGQTVTLGIRHADGSSGTVTVTLRPPAVAATEGALGIRATNAAPFEPVYDGQYVGRPLTEAIGIGAAETTRWLGVILGGLGEIAHSFATNPSSPPPAAGPVGIAVQIGDVFWGAGPIMTLYVAAALSANLALVNVLPFPPLDGGRMFVIILKRLFGERISVRAERLTYLVGFVFLFAFLIWVTGFDIARQLGGGQ